MHHCSTKIPYIFGTTTAITYDFAHGQRTYNRTIWNKIVAYRSMNIEHLRAAAHLRTQTTMHYFKRISFIIFVMCIELGRCLISLGNLVVKLNGENQVWNILAKSTYQQLIGIKNENA